MKKTRPLRSSSVEVRESRRMLAAETLNAAMRKDACSLRIALAMVEDSGLLDGEEIEWAQVALKSIDRFEDDIRAAFGTAAGNERTVKLHVAAKSFSEEIHVHRESAFWLLDDQGVLEVERAISGLIQAYKRVQDILRLLNARSLDMPEAPATLAAVPPNRYLAITHPELCR